MDTEGTLLFSDVGLIESVGKELNSKVGRKLGEKLTDGVPVGS